MQWFRFYSEAITDKKLRRIARETGQPIAQVIGIWTILLSIASESPQRGALLISQNVPATEDDIADLSGCNVTVTLQKLCSNDMVTNSNGVLRIANWDKRQYDSDSSRERVQKYRDKRRTEAISPENSAKTPQSNGDVTLHRRYSNVTVTPPDTDPDTDTDTDTDIKNIASTTPLAAQKETSSDISAIPTAPHAVEHSANGSTPKPVKAKRTPKPKPTADDEPTPTGQQEMFGALCQVIYGHSTYSILTPKQKALLGTEAANLLRIGATPETVARWYKEKWRATWPGNKGNAPSFEQARNGVAAFVEVANGDAPELPPVAERIHVVGPRSKVDESMAAIERVFSRIESGELSFGGFKE